MTYDANNPILEELSDIIDEDALAGDEQSKRNCLARKRIDDLMEKKRLKELLDDEDDWDV